MTYAAAALTQQIGWERYIGSDGHGREMYDTTMTVRGRLVPASGRVTRRGTSLPVRAELLTDRPIAPEDRITGPSGVVYTVADVTEAPAWVGTSHHVARLV